MRPMEFPFSYIILLVQEYNELASLFTIDSTFAPIQTHMSNLSTNINSNNTTHLNSDQQEHLQDVFTRVQTLECYLVRLHEKRLVSKEFLDNMKDLPVCY